ncbi:MULTISPECIES: YjcB family protein [Tatumella]|uniref:YjcB family protein n=1 Tax=Tatumella punctata TaxID=399969 RepID=A0ABW1VIY4_9GAMM|nr:MULTISPECIES: YjcB family protein [unclassified Tatumella]MBS0855509.1 hypothetical protein [Tatumella sp. JGM16]MBS0877109.1 hypothetical protein [Tatumella sp. JGM82]MBS0890623.1 hypothetical protein [Tatumella sp. JGM94]MBS0893295.1 hypothetical protein [Tatumella sp. JGM130]MBS0901412.1 hypothetical protein [Tatumella sp. JGM100]
MATLTANFLIMRWGLLSALAMFLASSATIKCRRHHLTLFSVLCAGFGVIMSCWFVTGLMGIPFSAEQWHGFVSNAQDILTQVIKNTPSSWPDE